MSAADRINKARKMLSDARDELEVAKLDLSSDDHEAVSEIGSEISEFRRTLGVIASRYEEAER